MPTSTVYLLMAVTLAIFLRLPTASAQVQFSEGWSHGKRDVTAQLRHALPMPLQEARQPPSLLDVLTSGARQSDDQCKPDAEALGLIYDLIMREVEKVINCRTNKGLLKPGFAA